MPRTFTEIALERALHELRAVREALANLAEALQEETEPKEGVIDE